MCITNKAVMLSKGILLNRAATNKVDINRALQCSNSRCNTNKDLHQNKRAAHAVEDV